MQQNRGAGQGHYRRSLGQQDHDKAHQKQGQLGPGIQGSDNMTLQGAPAIISLHLQLTFQKISIQYILNIPGKEQPDGEIPGVWSDHAGRGA
jgi:hypothetical protein